MYAVPLTNDLVYIILHTASKEKSAGRPAWGSEEKVNMDMLDEISEHAPGGKKVEERNEFQQACDDFVYAQRRFNKIDFRVRTDNAADASQWFHWLGQRYMTEKRVWELFCNGFETDKMIKLYLEFRGCLLRGDRLKPNA